MSLASGGGFAAEPDAWLGELLGRPALSVVHRPGAEAGWERRLATEPVFATAKLPTAELGLVIRLQDLGFRVVETALALDATALDAPADDPRVRFAVAADASAVADIAGSAFRFTRFHLDPAIPRRLADRIKREWAANFFTGRRGDGMIVAETDGRVRGFLQLLRAPEGRLIIDLVAVAPEAARQGLARAMIGLAAAEGTGDGRRPLGFRVGTQAANIASLQLYEGLGFRIVASRYVLHHHGTGAAYPTEIAG